MENAAHQRPLPSPHMKELEKAARKKSARDTKDMGSRMTEKDIDRMLKDSFPASDPPGTY
jgi:hypothetical protein